MKQSFVNDRLQIQKDLQELEDDIKLVENKVETNRLEKLAYQKNEKETSVNRKKGVLEKLKDATLRKFTKDSENLANKLKNLEDE